MLSEKLIENAKEEKEIIITNLIEEHLETIVSLETVSLEVKKEETVSLEVKKEEVLEKVVSLETVSLEVKTEEVKTEEVKTEEVVEKVLKEEEVKKTFFQKYLSCFKK
jgi:hypothetical protein